MAESKQIEILEHIRELLEELKPIDLGQIGRGAHLRYLVLLLNRLDPMIDIPRNQRIDFVTAHIRLSMGGANGKDFPMSKEYNKLIDRIFPIVVESLQSPIVPVHSPFKHFKDKKLQAILERDLLEAQKSFDARAYKACIVLCGSILETAVYEYLRRNETETNAKATEWFKPRKPKPIEGDDWKLKELITFACHHNILPKDREATFHDTLRDPRNLIHPTVELRDVHRIDENNAGMTKHALMVALAELYKKNEPWK